MTLWNCWLLTLLYRLRWKTTKFNSQLLSQGTHHIPVFPFMYKCASNLFVRGLPTILYTSCSPLHATCLAQLVFIDLIVPTLIMERCFLNRRVTNSMCHFVSMPSYILTIFSYFSRYRAAYSLSLFCSGFRYTVHFLGNQNNIRLLMSVMIPTFIYFRLPFLPLNRIQI